MSICSIMCSVRETATELEQKPECSSLVDESHYHSHKHAPSYLVPRYMWASQAYLLIINHTPSTIRAVISTLTCMSMASTSTNKNSVATVIIVRGLKCVIN